MLTYGKYLSSAKTPRAGVILYTLVDEKLYFLLAKHSKTGELGDFGGGVKKNEFSLNGGVREFFEESGGVFRSRYKSSNDFLDKVALIDNENKMAVIFAPIESFWIEGNKAQVSFEESMKNSKKKSSQEISEIVWVNEHDFLSLIKTPNRVRTCKLWSVVRKFFSKFSNLHEVPQILREINV